jgi:hypothetical protein
MDCPVGIVVAYALKKRCLSILLERNVSIADARQCIVAELVRLSRSSEYTEQLPHLAALCGILTQQPKGLLRKLRISPLAVATLYLKRLSGIDTVRCFNSSVCRSWFRRIVCLGAKQVRDGPRSSPATSAAVQLLWAYFGDRQTTELRADSARAALRGAAVHRAMRCLYNELCREPSKQNAYRSLNVAAFVADHVSAMELMLLCVAASESGVPFGRVTTYAAKFDSQQRCAVWGTADPGESKRAMWLTEEFVRLLSTANEEHVTAPHPGGTVSYAKPNSSKTKALWNLLSGAPSRSTRALICRLALLPPPLMRAALTAAAFGPVGGVQSAADCATPLSAAVHLRARRMDFDSVIAGCDNAVITQAMLRARSSAQTRKLLAAEGLR